MAANVLTLGPLFSARAAKLSVLSASSRGSGSGRGGSGSRDRGKTPSRTGSTRPFTRAESRASSHHTAHASVHSRAESVQSSEIDLKRTTHLIIQGPRRPMSVESIPSQGDISNSNSGGNSGGGDGQLPDEEYDLHVGEGAGHRRRYRGSIMEMPNLDPWPRGIIKTVSVRVIEEPNPDHDPNSSGATATAAGAAAAKSNIGKEIPAVPSREDRNSDGSVMEQDWETMLRAGPPGR